MEINGLPSVTMPLCLWGRIGGLTFTAIRHLLPTTLRATDPAQRWFSTVEPMRPAILILTFSLLFLSTAAGQWQPTNGPYGGLVGPLSSVGDTLVVAAPHGL